MSKKETDRTPEQIAQQIAQQAAEQLEIIKDEAKRLEIAKHAFASLLAAGKPAKQAAVQAVQGADELLKALAGDTEQQEAVSEQLKKRQDDEDTIASLFGWPAELGLMADADDQLVARVAADQLEYDNRQGQHAERVARAYEAGLEKPRKMEPYQWRG